MGASRGEDPRPGRGRASHILSRVTNSSPAARLSPSRSMAVHPCAQQRTPSGIAAPSPSPAPAPAPTPARLPRAPTSAAALSASSSRPASPQEPGRAKLGGDLRDHQRECCLGTTGAADQRAIVACRPPPPQRLAFSLSRFLRYVGPHQRNWLWTCARAALLGLCSVCIVKTCVLLSFFSLALRRCRGPCGRRALPATRARPRPCP